ncbi:MAG: WYL domain-containing protein [Flavobacteriales bacterium]|nr:WYL domain-containing protein [Flavobacteriales bacterium]
MCNLFALLMPTNKLASFRYRVIDKCLRNKYRKYTLEDLLHVLSKELYEQFGIDKGVSRRTFFNDINVMRSPYPRGFDAPIVCKNGYYMYEDPEFSIMHSPYNEDDLAALQEAINLLEQFKGLLHLESLYGILGKLKAEMATYHFPASPVILFDKNDAYAGIRWIEPLHGFIRKEQCLKLTYKPFIEEKEIEHTVHPYLLKEYNNRWFLLGWNEEEKLIYNFALDRIQQIKKCKCSFYKKGKELLLHYFDHIIGVSFPRDGHIERIVLDVNEELYPYLETKPLHPSQRPLDTSGKIKRIELQIIPNAEFEFLLMKYADRLEVVEPINLRKSIKKRLEKALRRWV